MKENSIREDRKYLNYLERSYFSSSKRTIDKPCRPQSCIIKRTPLNFDYKKSSPVYILRDQLKNNKSTTQVERPKYRDKQYLKQKLDGNCNVWMKGFQINRRDLQNILWEKNYLLKSSINELKQQNNNIKAKVWNFEKENRKMQKQIDSWNLEKHPLLGKKVPYLDSTTMDRVFQDQDYSVVTMKIELARLNQILDEKQSQIKKNNQILNNSKYYEQLVNGKIALEAKKLIKIVTDSNSEPIQQLKKIHDKVLCNNQKISVLQQELAFAKSSYQKYKQEKNKLQKPNQPVFGIYEQIKVSSKIKTKKMSEPLSHLRNEVEHQKQTIAGLQYKAQQIINQSLSQKQVLRKQIKQLQKQLQENSKII